MKLLFASRNLHKTLEFKQIIKEIEGIDVYTLRDFPDYRQPEETGETFIENAELKAAHAAKTLECIAISDDSGLVVPALNGAPGVFSRRYAGENATDRENNQKLLEEMKDLDGVSRSAYYECVISIADPEKILKTVTGRCEGWISEEPRGSQGFGYDPLFIKHDYDKTFAELEERVKNNVSHRYKAIQAAVPFLHSLLRKETLNEAGL